MNNKTMFSVLTIGLEADLQTSRVVSAIEILPRDLLRGDGDSAPSLPEAGFLVPILDVGMISEVKV